MELVDLLEKIEKRFGLRPKGEQLMAYLSSSNTTLEKASLNRLIEKLHKEQSNQEWQNLAEHLTIPETYFFRYNHQWQALRENIFPKLLKHTQKPLKAWSAACATGEEAYSLAMSYEEFKQGRNIPKLEVIGTDLVEEYLESARRGIYGENSFRGVSEQSRCFHFQKLEAKLYSVKNNYKDLVSFQQLNLIEDQTIKSFLLQEGPFDIIFCRNFLIYMSANLRKKIVESLCSGLKESGIIFFGAAEFPAMWTNALEPLHFEGALAWQKCTNKSSSQKQSPNKVTSARPENVPTKYTHNKYQLNKTHQKQPKVQPEESTKEIEYILQCIREGEHEKAFNAAQNLLTQKELQAEAYYTLGIIHELQGENKKAFDAYGQAIFLAPMLSFAYWRRAMLLSTQGEMIRALKEAKSAVDALSENEKQPFWLLPDMEKSSIQEMLSNTLNWLKQEAPL